MPKRMRSRAMTRKTPTPSATDQMMTLLGMDGTCSASTWRSGSATVMSTPMRKLSSTMTEILREEVISLPTYSPRGIMDISEPMVKRAMPRISMMPPTRNAIMALLETGVREKHSRVTMPMMGRTDTSDSRRGLRKTERKRAGSRGARNGLGREE